MYIITILPIARAINKSVLTYFSKEDIAPGGIVTVPVRSKNISGIVLTSENASSLKADLKILSYPLKKIHVESRESIFGESFMQTIKESANYFAATAGAVLANTVPKIFFEERFEKKELKLKLKNEKRFEEKAIQNDDSERIDIYKGIVRESFAKKESVFIACPTEESAKKTLESLKKGIEEYSILMSASLSKNKFKDAVKTINSSEHPMLIVGGLSYLPIFREDTSVIIVEEESSRFWKTQSRPFVDGRFFLKTFAKISKTKIIYSDSLLRVETLYRLREGEISEYARVMARGHKSIQTLLVDMRNKEKSEKTPVEKNTISKEEALSKKDTEFKIISNELKEMISYADKHNKSIFLLGVRRGLAPQTVCEDCKETVLCKNCLAPVVLHKRSSGNLFICHHCGKSRGAEETCQKCGSWRLLPLGIGVERIVEEISKISEREIIRIDSDTSKTTEAAKKNIEKFLEKKCILIGTELALNHLPEKTADYCAVVSFDSLFSLPDFRMEEKIMHLILKAKTVARENFLVQSRNTESSIVEYALSSDLANFAKYEISSREKFNYPPFKTLIKITVSGKKETVADETVKIADLLEKYSPTIFPAFIKTIKGNTVAHILLKLDPKDWPDETLREILLSLPPSVAVKVDPESLL